MAEPSTRSPVQPPELQLTERRAWVRLRSEQDITCYGEEAKTGWLGGIQDISLSGLSLVLQRRFAPGTVLVVELATKPSGRLYRLVRVLHATQENNDRWILGCAFARPLGEHELQTFVGQ